MRTLYQTPTLDELFAVLCNAAAEVSFEIQGGVAPENLIQLTKYNPDEKKVYGRIIGKTEYASSLLEKPNLRYYEKGKVSDFSTKSITDDVVVGFNSSKKITATPHTSVEQAWYKLLIHNLSPSIDNVKEKISDNGAISVYLQEALEYSGNSSERDEILGFIEKKVKLVRPKNTHLIHTVGSTSPPYTSTLVVPIVGGGVYNIFSLKNGAEKELSIAFIPQFNVSTLRDITSMQWNENAVLIKT